ncbi:PadR family transcriptional regulator [Clostridium sp. 19966]|uniref:PadR family transcriptional regulator n=1 Tax=Clostridium sp. 19966 TaxID=2768166 RepID=UPI0028DFD44B|nr:PadR family transcriptional regulator [Clostridium sp. 19966]MDT8716772.1 PadR family transcriptional regulator [Clostridium sp. 19966]
MDLEDKAKKYIPLTEATYYILISLTEPLHGYAIMQKVDDMTEGKVKLGPGTLYGAIGKLVKQGFIIEAAEDDDEGRRKSYRLTELGKMVIMLEHSRIKLLYDNSKKALDLLKGE